jgi:hypothetical protein
MMPAGSREELAAAMRGDPGDVAGHLPHTLERFRGLGKSAVAAEGGWVTARVGLFLQDRTYLSDLDAARMLVALGDPGVRAATVRAMAREDAPDHCELWQNLTRRAPDEVRDTPATLLALSSWLEGPGARAWTALDQLSKPNRLSELVDDALRQALDPKVWDQVAPPVLNGALLQRAILRQTGSPGQAHTRHHPPAPKPDQPGPAVHR